MPERKAVVPVPLPTARPKGAAEEEDDVEEIAELTETIRNDPDYKGGNYTDQSEYLRVFISHLRKKIEPDPAKPRYILTDPWVGYRFQPGESTNQDSSQP